MLAVVNMGVQKKKYVERIWRRSQTLDEVVSSKYLACKLKNLPKHKNSSVYSGKNRFEMFNFVLFDRVVVGTGEVCGWFFKFIKECYLLNTIPKC